MRLKHCSNNNVYKKEVHGLVKVCEPLLIFISDVKRHHFPTLLPANVLIKIYIVPFEQEKLAK